MSRSVVLGNTPRCEHCRLAPRWCICDGFHAVECPLQINVLIHYREFWRPTSTGRLITRVIPSSRSQVFRPDLPLAPTPLIQLDRPLWILHPLGEPMPANSPPPGLQVLLLDGSWREAARMGQAVRTWGPRVSLPITGASRYFLRGQQGTGNYSTVEALLFLLKAFGFEEAQTQVRLQFELHVYAGLRTRGEKKLAEEFLAESPLRDAFPELLMKLDERRPRT